MESCVLCRSCWKSMRMKKKECKNIELGDTYALPATKKKH